MVKRLICSFLAVSLSISLCACGNREEYPENVTISFEDSKPVSVATASEMKLAKTTGAVQVTDDSNAQQPVIADMNLYHGYGVGTEPISYAWVNIDHTKLLKMDEQSHANLEANGRKLKINLDSGSMFFCVLEDLEKDEALEFATPSTSNMAMSVRGTTGVVEVVSRTETKVILLEGEVSGTVGSESFTLTTGEVAEVTADASGEASIKTRKIDYAEDVPYFAIREVLTNSDIEAKIQGNGGFTDYPEEMTDVALHEIYGDVLACYRTALSGEIIERDPLDYTRYLDEIKGIGSFVPKADSWYDNLYECTETGFTTEDLENLKNWKYAFHDLNDDGLPELIIADNTLEEGTGIRSCWTTDGTDVTQIMRLGRTFTCVKLSSNGYLFILDANDFTDYYAYKATPQGFESEYSFVIETVPFLPNLIEMQYVDRWDVRISDGTTTYYDPSFVYRLNDRWERGLCYTLAPGESFDEEKLHSGGYSSLDEDYTFELFMNEHYPIIPDTTLNWQPLS